MGNSVPSLSDTQMGREPSPSSLEEAGVREGVREREKSVCVCVYERVSNKERLSESFYNGCCKCTQNSYTCIVVHVKSIVYQFLRLCALLSLLLL